MSNFLEAGKGEGKRRGNKGRGRRERGIEGRREGEGKREREENGRKETFIIVYVDCDDTWRTHEALHGT